MTARLVVSVWSTWSAAPRAARATALVTLGGAFLGASAPGVALAQAPPGTQPGQVERQFQAPPQPRSQPGQFQIPLPSQTAPAGSEGIRFRLRGLSLEGISVYPADSWSAQYTRLLGREVSLADLYAFADALTTRYRNDGYILSQVIVPAQTVEQGYVRLQAVEGYIADVRFAGEGGPGRGGATALMTAYAERVRAERPLTAATLERGLLSMNDLPGTFARALLTASATQQGASDLVVEVSHQPFGAGFSVDNRGGRSLGPWRASVDVEQRGLLGWGERTGARFVAAEKSELEYASFFHDQPIGRDGTRVGITYSRVRSTPDTGGSFIPLNLETSSDSAALTLSHPVTRSRNSNLSVRASLTGHNGETQLFGVRDTEDRLRTLRFGLTFDLADAARGINLVDIELARGFEGAGSSQAGDPLLSRANGKPAFTKLGLYAARLQGLWPGWSLLAALSAQTTFDDLLAPELFSVGGEQFGRGYDPSEIVGDHGAAIKLELRYTFGGDGGGAAPAAGATLYGFYDAGSVRQRSPGGLDAQQSLSSTGLGIRFDLRRWLTGYLEVAKPLSRTVAAEGNRDPRVYGGLSVRY